MMVDNLQKQLVDTILMGRMRQAQQDKSQSNIRGEIPPEVLLQLLQPNIMSSEDRIRKMFELEGMGPPTKDDFKDYPTFTNDMDMEQTPENMMINKALGVNI